MKKNSGINSTVTLPTYPCAVGINKLSTIKKSQTKLNQGVNFQTSLQNIPLLNSNNLVHDLSQKHLKQTY